jgi:hypothetical protein
MQESESLNQLPPKTDLSTPEEAVKTCWQLVKYYVLKYLSEKPAYAKQFATEAVVGKLKSFYDKERLFDKEFSIEKVERINGTTVLVYCKAFLYPHHDEKDKMRYKVEKYGDKWFVAADEEVCFNCKGTGAAPSYQEDKSKGCEYCNGTGWREGTLI